ncbi:MAG: PAS domain-containing protein [Rhodospirillaceae bacterium]|nr:PAS domain-containing protein [Rhodospirillaceae bacterium]MBT6119113.1 PAS domain-containing protein [Rhodospirillaceae bacterium]
MTARAKPQPAPESYGPEPTEDAILSALPSPVLALEGDGTVSYGNTAAEQFFNISAKRMIGRPLSEFLPADSAIRALIDRAAVSGRSLAEYDLLVDTPRTGQRLINLHVAPMADRVGGAVISFEPAAGARRLDERLLHRHAARSISGLAAMLAHEVKNPLSGIRGAAQLVERGLNEEDRALTGLIRDEVDRIVALVDRVEAVSGERLPRQDPVNIHAVLEHVRRIAETGFAGHLRFADSYDPSLPPARGDRDLLIQVVLNLVKNAAEAIGDGAGTVRLETAYEHGVRVSGPAGGSVHLPLALRVIDDGPGIPEGLRASLFDPFVTSKADGSGLGLALVAKVIGDHGGAVEVDSRPGETTFTIRLPIHGAGPVQSTGPAHRAEADDREDLGA